MTKRDGLTDSARGRFLIFEDDVTGALFLQHVLERHGHEVEAIYPEARNLAERLALHRPDLVLLDIRLSGGVTGVEAAQQCAILGYPFLFVTGESDESVLGAARAANPVAFVHKPFSERQLAMTLELALKNVRLTRSLTEQADRFRAVFDLSPAAQLLTEADSGVILAVNRQAARLPAGVKEPEPGQYLDAWAGTPGINARGHGTIEIPGAEGAGMRLRVVKTGGFDSGVRRVHQWTIEPDSGNTGENPRFPGAMVLDAWPEAVLVTRRDGATGEPLIVYANPAFFRLTGWPVRELEGTTATQLSAREQTAGSLFDEDSLNSGRLASSGNAALRTSGGQILPVVYTADLIDGLLPGGPARLFRFKPAPSESASARTARSSHEVESLLEWSPQAVLVLDLEGRVAVFNQAAAALYRLTERTGMERGQVPGGIWHDEGLPTALAGDSPLQTISREQRIEKAEGQFSWYRFDYSHLHTPAGEPAGRMVIATEITAEKEIALERQLLMKRLQGALDASTDGVLMVDASGAVLDANASAEALFGFTAEQLSRAAFFDLIRQCRFKPGDRRKARDIRNPVSSPLIEEVTALRRDGSAFDAEMSVSTFDVDGFVFHTVFVRDISIRKHESAVLSAERDLLDLILKTSLTPILLFRPDGKVKFANPRAIEYFHLIWSSASASYELPYAMLQPEEGQPFGLDELAARLKDGRLDRTVRLTVQWPGEGRRHFFATGTPAGEGVVVSTLDVTRSTEFVSALRESESRFRTMADSAPVMIWMTDRSGNLVYVNRPWKTFTGLEMAPTFTRFDEHIHPDDLDLVQTVRRRTFDAAAVSSYGYRLRNASGEYRWVTDYASPRTLEDGSMAGFIGCIVDVHNEKVARRELSTLAERIQKISLHIPGFIYQLRVAEGEEPVLLYASRGIEDLFGIAPEAAIQQTRRVFDRMHPDDRTDLLERLKQAGATSGTERRTFRVVRDGQIRWMESEATSEKMSDGSLVWSGYITDITERQEAEQRLRDSENRFHSIFEKHGAPMLLVDPAGGAILDANLAAETFYGYAPGVLKTMRVDDLNTLPPEKVAEFRRKAKEERVNHFNFDHRLADGTQRAVEVHSSPIHIGGATLLFSIIHDVTQRAEAEREVLKQRELLHTIINHIPDTIYVKDVNFRKILANQAEIKYSGFEKLEEVLGKDDEELYGAGGRREINEIERRVIENGEAIINREDAFANHRGEIYHFLTTKIPLRDSTGRILGLVGIGKNITERKKMEEALLESEARYRQLVEEQRDFVLVSDPDTTITFANGALCRALGVVPEQILGKRWIDFAAPEDIKGIENQITALRPDAPTFMFENRDRRADGVLGWTQWLNTGIFDENGRLIRIQSAGRDITLVRQAEEEADRARLQLEQKNREFEAIFHAIPDLFFRLDKDGTILGFYAGEHSKLILPPEQFMGRTVAGILPPAAAGQTVSLTQKALLTGERQQFEYELDLAGERRYFESNLHRLSANEVIAVVRDITSRKMIEREREVSENRMRAVIATQTNYVIRTDLNGLYTYYNGKFEQDFGWLHGTSGFIGHSCMDSVVPEHHQRVLDTVARCFEYPNRVFQIELDKPRSPSGGLRTTLWDFICLTDADGKPAEIQCMGIDISERKVAEEALAKERKNLELILSNMSNGVIMLQRNGRPAFLNGQALDLIGAGPGDLDHAYGLLRTMEFFDREGVRYVWKRMPVVRTLRDGTSFRNLLFRYVRPQGDSRWISLSGAPIRDPDGLIQSVVCSFSDVTHEVEADEKLRESEQRFKSLADDAPVFILLHEQGQPEAYLNNSFKKFLGVRAVPGAANLSLLVNELDREAYESALLQASRSDQPVTVDFQLERYDGTWRWISCTLSFTGDRHSAGRRMLLTALDVTAVRDAERMLRESNETLEKVVADRTFELTQLNVQLVDEIRQRNAAEAQREEVKRKLDEAYRQLESINANINEAVYRSNPKQLIYANRAMASMFGYDSVAELMAAPVESLYLNPSDRHRFLAHVSAGGAWQNVEITMKRKDASPFTVLMGGVAAFNDDGTIRHIDGTMRDITTLKQAREELDRTTRNLAQAQQLALLGYWTLNVRDNKPAWDENLYAQNGLQHIHPMPFSDEFASMCTNHDCQTMQAVAEKAMLEGQSTYEIVLNVQGRLRYVKGQIRLADPVRPEFTCTLFGVVRDVTAEKISELEMERAKEAAENLARAKQQFLANMSHEIRTPINGIRGMTHLLSETGLNGEQTQFVHAIKQSSDTLMGIINDILDIAKIDAGKIVFERTPFSIKQVIQSVAQIVEIKARDKRLPLLLHLGDDLPDLVVGDSLRLSQVLTNLLDNAVKFTEKGHVQLKADLAGEQSDSWDIRFSVIDTGIGIPQENLNKVFELFEQSDSSITRKFGGTGLGLAIVKRLIEHQGGTLSVQSKPGRGTTFQFVLSFAKPQEFQYRRDEHKPAAHEPLIADLRVLVVDDNAINRLWVSKLLKNWGCTIIEAANGLEAVEMARKHPVDLILMDLYMPEMDGYEASRQIRIELPSPKSSVPIIALTADVLDDQDRRVREATIDAWLGKPFDPAELHQLMLQLTVQAREMRENTRKMEAIREHDGLLDFSHLADLTGGDVAFMDKLTLEFQHLLVEVLAELRTAADQGDLEALRKLVHKTKPNLEYFGATDTFELAGLLLQKYKSGGVSSMDDIREPLMNFIDKLEAIEEVLRKAGQV